LSLIAYYNEAVLDTWARISSPSVPLPSDGIYGFDLIDCEVDVLTNSDGLEEKIHLDLSWELVNMSDGLFRTESVSQKNIFNMVRSNGCVVRFSNLRDRKE